MNKIGRPKGENNKECVCTIRLDENTMTRLNHYCEYMGIAKSEAIRTAINKMMDQATLKFDGKFH